MIPMEPVNRIALHKAIQTMCMVNKDRDSSLGMARDSSSSILMSLLRVCSEDRGEKVLDHLLPPPLQLARVQWRKTIENSLSTVILVSALLVLLFSSLRRNTLLSVSMLLNRLFCSCPSLLC